MLAIQRCCEMMNSMRRLAARPAGVWLSMIGKSDPIPWDVIASLGQLPLATKYF